MIHEQLLIFTFRWGANLSKMYSGSQILPVLSALCYVLDSMGHTLHQDTVTTGHTCLHVHVLPCLCLKRQATMCLDASAPKLSWHSFDCNIHRAQSFTAPSATCHLNHALLSFMTPFISRLVHAASGTSCWCQLSMSYQHM